MPDLTAIYSKPFPREVKQFWKACLKKSPMAPLKSQKNWTLVGPFRVLAGKSPTFENPIDACMYQRCYHDTPEFQTFAIESSNASNRLAFYHLAPEHKDPYIVQIQRCGSDPIMPVFTLICKASEITEDIFSSKPKPLVKKIVDSNFPLVAKTLTGIGISVPMSGDDNDIGYRPLNHSNSKWKTIFSKIEKATDDKIRKTGFDPILETITYIQYANDECDPGMGYEFGIDLMVYGSKYLTRQCSKVLPLAYKLLNRKLFAEISEKHLANRKDELSAAEKASFFKS